MAYTKEQKQLYQDIKQEQLEFGETPKQAELEAREYLYYTRREQRMAKAEEEDRSSNGWHLLAPMR